MSERVPFGLVGVGVHGEAVIDAFAKSGRVAELVAACDPREERRAVAEACGLHVYPDLAAMLAAEKLAAVHVATLPGSHPALAEEAFRAGCHVLCEKPLAPTTDECRRMVRAAAAAGRRLAVVFERRYSEPMRRVRTWIREGVLGEVEAIHLQHLWDAHKSFGPRAERRQRLADASGALDHGVHFLDLARFFLGGGEYTEILARGVWLGDDVAKAPHISLLTRLDGRTLVTLNVSGSYTAHIERRAQSHGLSVVGTRGVVERRERMLRLVAADREEEISLGDWSEKTAIARLADDFAEVISGRKAASAEMPTGEDGLYAQAVVEEANRQAVESRTG